MGLRGRAQAIPNRGPRKQVRPDTPRSPRAPYGDRQLEVGKLQGNPPALATGFRNDDGRGLDRKRRRGHGQDGFLLEPHRRESQRQRWAQGLLGKDAHAAQQPRLVAVAVDTRGEATGAQTRLHTQARLCHRGVGEAKRQACQHASQHACRRWLDSDVRSCTPTGNSNRVTAVVPSDRLSGSSATRAAIGSGSAARLGAMHLHACHRVTQRPSTRSPPRSPRAGHATDGDAATACSARWTDVGGIDLGNERLSGLAERQQEDPLVRRGLGTARLRAP